MPDVTTTLQEILGDHGVKTQLNADGWLITDSPYPACRAFTDDPQPVGGGWKLLMDVEIALSPERTIVESFSDFGVDPRHAFQSSLQNFCSGTLHVLLSSLWGEVDDSQVCVERCNVNGQPWIFHLGNIVRKAKDGADVPPPHDLFPILDRVISDLQLDAGIHWGRLFYANVPNRRSVVEALIDNEPSQIAQKHFGMASWARSDFFYSHRIFWILKAVS